MAKKQDQKDNRGYSYAGDSYQKQAAQNAPNGVVSKQWKAQRERELYQQSMPSGMKKRYLKTGNAQRKSEYDRQRIADGFKSVTGSTSSNDRVKPTQKQESYKERKTREDKARVASQQSRIDAAAQRGASGQAFRANGDKSYMSGAEYKAWKTAQDQAKKKKGK